MYGKCKISILFVQIFFFTANESFEDAYFIAF